VTVSDSAPSRSLNRNIKELSKHSIIYGVGVLSRISSFILLPIHTAYLSQHDYGILILVLSFIGIATVFTTYGLNVSFLRWYVPETDAQERKRIFSICYYGIAGVTLLLTLIIVNTSASIADLLLRDTIYQPMLFIAGFILLMDALFHFPQILLQAQNKSFGYIGVVFLNVTLNLGLSYYLIVQRGLGINGALYSALIAGIGAFVVTIPLVLKNLTIHFSITKYIEFVKYGIPYVANYLFVVLIDLSDRLLLERFLNAENVALYSANYKLGAAMSIVVNAFRLAWHPFFLSLSNSPIAKHTFARVFSYFLLISCGIFLSISIFIDDIVRINVGGFYLIAEKYWEGTFIIPWILFSYLISGSYVIFAAGIHIEKKTKFTPLFTGSGLLTNFIANIILIPILGIYGAAISTAIGYGVMTVFQYFTVQKFYHIKYEYIRLFKILVSTAIIFSAFKIYFSEATVGIKFAILLAYPALLFLSKFFLKSEWNEMKSLGLKLIGRTNQS